MEKTNNIFLIGFMGTGKTTIGKLLSSKLNFKLIDLDEIIVKSQGMDIKDIFSIYGEEHFRNIEHEALKNAIKNKRAVFSCGGGIILRDDNISLMKQHGKVILLTATPESIYNRISSDSSRPVLSGNMNARHIKDVLLIRQSQYEKAMDIAIKTDNRLAEEVCAEILKLL